MTASDRLLVLFVVVGTVAYLGAFPPALLHVDEGTYLYEAVRITEGQRLYRDVFEITTPAWMYLVAGLYWLFGPSLILARWTVAFLHGATAALLYVASRRCGVRPALAAIAPLGYLVAAQPAWPVASQHWLACFLSVAALTVCLGEDTRSRALRAGLLGGLLMATHQRGAAVLAGLALALGARAVLRGRGIPGLMGRLGAFAVGVAVVWVPLVGFLLWSAGVTALWEQLVLRPLGGYRDVNHAQWGQTGMLQLMASWTIPWLLSVLPFVLMPTAVRGVLAFARGDRVGASRLATLLLVSLAALGSIAYYPDFVHLAFVAPLLLVSLTENLEGFHVTIERVLRVRPARALLAMLSLFAGWRLWGTLVDHQRRFPISLDTAFGRVHVGAPVVADVVALVRRLLDESGSRLVYVYPFSSDPYLLAGGHNPTRFGFFFPNRFNTRAETAEVIATLESRCVPYVVLGGFLFVPDDPIAEYVKGHYAPIGSDPASRFVFRRSGSCRRDGDSGAR